MKGFVAVFLLMNITLGFGESLVDLEMEILAKIPVGRNPGQVYFNFYTNGDWEYPSGPFIDGTGRIILYQSTPEPNLLIFERPGLSSFPYTGSLDQSREVERFRVDSQQGVSIRDAAFVFQNNQIRTIAELPPSSYTVLRDYRNYPAPFGMISYSTKDKRGVAFGFDVANPGAGTSFVDSDHLPAWLRSQAGGFSVGDDGLLYRKGVLWSSPEPKDASGNMYTWTFLGRLMSGHPVWGLGSERRMRQFVVTDTLGNIEMRLSLNSDELSTFCLGPWGELYFLFPPPLVETTTRVSDHGGGSVVARIFDSTQPAKLVIIRNYLRYFGRLSDSGVPLRKGPTTNSEVLGTYPMKAGFRILEKSLQKETIGGEQNVWYKVRLLDGEVGWFFGAYVRSLFDGPNGQSPPWPNVPDW